MDSLDNSSFNALIINLPILAVIISTIVMIQNGRCRGCMSKERGSCLCSKWPKKAIPNKNES